MSLTTQRSILLVDDDCTMRRMLTEYLIIYGYRVDGAATVAEATAALSNRPYDLVLLDLTLPDGDGIDLTRQWRAAKQMPIIHITGRTDEADRVMGLELGADDYIVKPFSLRELLARMRAVMRRATSPALPTPVTRGRHPHSWRFAGWTLNVNMRRLSSPNGTLVPLTNSQFNLLTVFLESPRCILSRERLMRKAGAFDDIHDRAIDVQVMRLRRKLEADHKLPELLRTERGVGYFLDTDVDPLWG